LQQLWLFWVAPLIGGALGGLIHKALLSEEDSYLLRARRA
jgi:aquaporin Z